MAAIYIDVRISGLRLPLLIVFLLALVTVLVKFRWRPISALLCLGCSVVVLLWWLSLKPSDIGNWQENVSRVAWAEVHGDDVTIHNVRNCDYRTEMDYSNCWSDRTVKLSHLQHVDLFFTTWGAPGIGHPILSFDFGDGQHIAFSIEARYKVGQGYSALLGLFRQYDLIFIAADERDVIRLRTNFRKDEEVFLYRGNLDAAVSRSIFESYIQYLNKLKNQPEWYNAITRNCTTTMDSAMAKDTTNAQPWNYQLLLNGTLDRLMYQRGRIVSDGLPFPELKRRAHINPAAQAAGNSPDYSALIRVDRPGFH
jgi:hypothetical protein